MKNSANNFSFITAKKTMAFMVTVIAALAVSFFFLGQSHSDENKKAGEPISPMSVVQGDQIAVPASSPLRKRIIVSTVESATPNHAISLPAVVEADPATTVSIYPPLTGKLAEIKVKLGDPVKAGQIVAVVNSPDLGQAYADADKARDALDLAKRALDRGEGVFTAGANASKDLELIKSNYNQALAEFNRAEERLKLLGVASDASAKDAKGRMLIISSPVSGTVTALNGGVGSFLNDPTAAIMTISNLDHVWITANVPEDLTALLHAGQSADITLDAYLGQVWHGKIASVSTVLDPDTHRNKARFSFANADGRLKPNMYAQVKLAAVQSGNLMVPTSALLMNNDTITVFVETAPWTFKRHTVTIGSEDGDHVSVLTGLHAGDRVVVAGGVLIND